MQSSGGSAGRVWASPRAKSSLLTVQKGILALMFSILQLNSPVEGMKISWGSFDWKETCNNVRQLVGRFDGSQLRMAGRGAAKGESRHLMQPQLQPGGPAPMRSAVWSDLGFRDAHIPRILVLKTPLESHYDKLHDVRISGSPP